MTTQHRLKEIMLANKLNLKEFSEKIKIPYRTLQNYLLGKRTIRMDALTNICIHMGINLNWLATGKGEMYDRKGTEKVKTLGGTIEWLNE
ncbi:MAG TPA: XRE family transcriptional regulator, partial [Gammaproteobacteria bacterium]|nr:XRE family transcriptional regulator [Gammaproteobacteria bacterium]